LSIFYFLLSMVYGLWTIDYGPCAKLLIEFPSE